MNRNASGLLLLLGLGLTVLLSGKRSNKRGITPVKGKINSGFGNRVHPISKKVEFHNGVDIHADVGTTVLDPWDGVVENTYFADKGGNQLVIRHDNGFRTGYAHLSAFLVKKGEKVKAGDPIALTGNTGASTGPHLHLTVTDPNGKKVDPEKYFKFS